VEWFNQLDSTYRGELRELNDLNCSRFDARLDGAITGLEARFNARMAIFEARITRWMLLFWVGTLGTIIALIKL
jgi:hypothetical protein